jgi:hypothetical protein
MSTTQALFFRTFAYQRRQWFSNICCVSLCPLLMVLVASMLGTLINSLILKSNPVKTYLYCSNIRAQNDLNIPYWSQTDPRIPITEGDVLNVLKTLTLGQLCHD